MVCFGIETIEAADLNKFRRVKYSSFATSIFSNANTVWQAGKFL